MKKNIPGAVIDIPEMEISNQRPVYEVTIKKDGKVIYFNTTYAVVMNMVQSVTEVNLKEMSLEGDSQVVSVGHPIIQMFALDQLRKKMVRVTSLAMDMLIQAGRHNSLSVIKNDLNEIGKLNSIK